MSKDTTLEGSRSFKVHNRSSGKIRTWLLVALIVTGFIAGAFGSLGSLVFLNSTTTGARWRSALGIKADSPLSINRTKTERIVVEESSAIIKAAETIKPSVVSITGEEVASPYSFASSESAASGFIVTSDGIIVTNKHVVSDENANYTVYLADGKKYSAKVIARDPYDDLAFVKIDERSLPMADLGDSDQLKVGQWVIAVGNALGEYENSVTVGVVSAKNRQVSPSDPSTGVTERLEGLIQTDASIFPGNSGGPLVNLQGKVVGINTAKGPDQGLGFAIPINSIKNALESVKNTGKIVRPMLGVSFVPVNAQVAKNYNLPVDYGVLIYAPMGQTAIVSGSPAEKAGLQIGDIIIEINGDRIDEKSSLRSILGKYKPGDEVTLKLMRDRKEKTVKVKLAEMK
ncbi:MAG: trypsin-like peptidase domain-containing protein [bacterium]|nr:trypsin-like peptidase domain-containing protein [bacterium]